MAELVGDAYVRIYADTKFMADAIERDMKKVGKSGADSLIANFDKTLKASARSRLRSAQLSLADAITGGDFDAMLKKSNLSVSEFVDQIIDDLDRLETNPKIKFKAIDDALDSLDDWAQRATVREEADRLALSLDADWRAAERLNRAFNEQERIGASLAARFEALDSKAWQQDIRKLTADMTAHNRALDEAEDAARRVNEELRKTGKIETTRTFSRIRNGIHELNRDLDRFAVGGGIGRLFGKGNRNDFLNFIGSAVGGITQLGEALVRLPIRAVESMANGLGGLIDQFKDLREAGQSIPQILGAGLASGLKTGIIGLAAFTISLSALAVVLPGVVSLASALLGGLTAAAGALYFAVAGTLLPLVPIVVGLVAALGPVALGVAGVTKAIQDQDKRVAGIVKAWEKFQGATQPFVRDFIAVINDMSGALEGVTPFVQDMGTEVLDFMRNLRKAFSTPEMEKFIEEWQTTLPIIFENAGQAVTNLAAGLTAFFAAILPDAETLSAKFVDMTQQFLDWATSAKGQNSIKEFMDKAYDAADSLWGILGNVTSALGNIFDIGQEDAGKSLLQYFEDLTQRFEDFTDSAQGQESIRGWFERAKEAGDKLFTIIGDIFTFFETLDTEKAAEDLGNFLTAMTKIGQYADDFATALATIGEAVQMSTLVGALGIVNENFDDIARSMHDFEQDFTATFDRLRAQLERMPAIFSSPLLLIPGIIAATLGAVPQAMRTPIDLAITLVGGALATLPALVTGRLQGIPQLATAAVAGITSLLPEPFRSALSNIATVLTGGPGVIRASVSGWASAAQGAISGVYTVLTQPFRDAIDYIRGILADIRAQASRIPGVSQLGNLIRDNAAGGILYGPTMVGPFDRAGEAGREAIVPLDRPLSMIDPSVRALAAFAQGKSFSNGMVGGRQVTVMPGAIVATIPNTNPMAAAEALLDRIVASLATAG